MTTLVNQVRTLMKQGEYDPSKLFKIVYARNPVHYSRVREAIHIAKTE